MTFDWRYTLSRLILLTIGALVVAASVTIFFIPSDIAPSGMSGIAVILHELVDVPIGLVILLGNIPIQILAFRMLRGWRAVLETIYAVVLYSVALEILQAATPLVGVSDDQLLNALFGGIVGGIGSGLIYRAGGSMGGSSTLARVLRNKFGISLSTSSLYTDTVVIAGAGLVFGWESALYATLALFINRMASDYMMEGASSTSTAIIITNRPDAVIQAVTNHLHRGVTTWQGQGRANNPRTIVLVTLSRSEVNGLRKMIGVVDDSAFVSVLRGQVTYGRGFKPFQPSMPLKLDEVEDDTRLDTQEIRRTLT